MCIYYSKFFDSPDPRFAGPSPHPQYAPDRNFDTVHIKIEIVLDIAKKTADCVCTSTFRSLTSNDKLILDAVNFKIASIKDKNGKVLKYNYNNSKIEISVGDVEAGKEIIVVITYKVVDPKLGVYFVGPDKDYPKKPTHVWSHNEPEEARYWFPSHDAPNDKAITETIITVTNQFIAVSNGVLVKTTENKKDKTKTFHWKMSKPHSTYLVSFVVGDFAEVRDKWKNVPVTYYCQKGREQDIVRAFGKTPQMIDFFSKKIGVNYPYEKYAQIAVADFIFGGMEHTTATTQTDDALHDERAHEEAKYFSDGLCAHELAHQWFGNFITCKDWSHLWLNESFATYFDALYEEHDRGNDEFVYTMYQNAKSYFAEDKDSYRRPIVTNLYKRPNDLTDRHTYQKGSTILHMLRNILGDELWWKVINNYVKRNHNRAVETLDFIHSIEQVTGLNMKKFFDQWIFGPGHPEYGVLYFFDEKTKEVNVRISQNQSHDTGMFSVKMKFEFTTKNGIKTFEEVVEQKEHLFKYKLDSEPLMLRVDPDNFILKKIDQAKPKSMWLYQLEFDSNVIGRITAANEVSKYGTNKDAEILGKVMLKEKFWGVQAEIAALLGQMRNQTALEYLIKGLSIKHPLARKAVVAALGEFRDSKIIKDLKNVIEDKTSYIVPAEAYRSLCKTKDISVEPIIKTAFERESWLDVIRSCALDGLAQLHGEGSIETMKRYAKRGNEDRTRFVAIRNLAAFGKGRHDILEILIELTNDNYTLVQIAAVDALGELRDERAIPILEKLTKGDRDGRVHRAAEDAIKKIYPWLESDMESYRLAEEIKNKKRAV
ncbi:MAG TPA: M1 family aminopeptidase [archaeon]|nr:M1 family aminopeptidase [archaeon]